MKTYNNNHDLEGDKIVLPTIGEQVLRDGYRFSVTYVLPHNDLGIVASILMRGKSGEVEVGYYDFKKHQKAN